jgi:hypothetical protein
MMMVPLFARVTRRTGKQSQRFPIKRRRSFVPRLEGLEDRTVPSTLTVTTNADSGPGSLRAVIASASAGDTIVFSSILTGQTIALTTGELDITKNLTISGLGAEKLTIDGGSSGRVFAISSGIAASLSGLTIADGLADQGGGIDNAGSLTLSQCTLSNNVAMGDSAASGVGGGILNEAGASLTVAGCKFTRDQVFGGTAGLGFGGGIMNLGSASIADTTFSKNTATGGNDNGNGYGAGGAISSQNGAVLTIDTSAFTDNQAVQGLGALAAGGAIDNEVNATLTITNSVFARNQTLGGGCIGGAIVSAQATLNVANCAFQHNVSSGFFVGESGAIESQFGQATIASSSFINNVAMATGPGGAGVAGAIRNLFGSMTLTNCELTANRCIGGDGADGVHNFGQANGGAIFNRVGTLTVDHCTLTGNTAHGGSGGTNNPDRAVGSAFGGGIFNFVFSTLTVTNSSFRGNAAIAGDSGAGFGSQADGGAIDNDVHSTLSLSGTILAGNLAQGGAGAAGFAGGDGIGGGFVNLFSSIATSTNALIAENSAIGGDGGAGAKGGFGLGGGIVNGHPRGLEAVVDSSSLTLTNSIVAGNVAQGGSGGTGGSGGDGLGGGILMGLLTGPSASTMTVAGSLVAGNVAAGGMGGISGDGGNGFGGGFYIAGGNACLENSTVAFNVALGGLPGSGGNSSEGIGGGLYIVSTANVGAVGTSIFGNFASTSNDDVFGSINPNC